MGEKQGKSVDAIKNHVEQIRKSEQEINDIQHTQERYRIAAQNSNEIIIEYNIETQTLLHDTDRVTTIYGVPQSIDYGPEYLVHCGVVMAESAGDFLGLFQKIHQGEKRAECMIKTRTVEGTLLWNQLILTAVGGTPACAVGLLRDITEQRQAQLQYESEIQHRDAMMKDALLYYEANATKKLLVSGMEQLLAANGLNEKVTYEEALGVLVESLVYQLDRPEVQKAFLAENLLQAFAAGEEKVEREYRRVGEDGALLWVRGTAYLAADKESGDVKIYYYVKDIDAAKTRMLQYQQQAERDLLTGLYNKLTAERLIREAILEGEQEGQLSAFFIVDLDDFKQINDQLGHAYGDAVLSETAQKLQSMCRQGDVAGRIGGDEYVLYLKHLPNSTVALRRAEQICTLFSGGVNGCKISATVGIALLPEHGQDVETLYRHADSAMYQAKNQGKNTWCMYDHNLKGHMEHWSRRVRIDRTEGKSFGDNVVEYVLRILYEAQDLSKAISGIVELMAKHFHFSRGYVYEKQAKGDLACTFEWCQGSFAPFSPALQILRGALLQEYEERFQQGGIYELNDPQTLPVVEGQLSDLNGLHARFQCAFSGRGAVQGFMGFDRYAEAQPITTEEREAIAGVTQMLDIFLSGKRASWDLEKAQIMLESVADCLRSCTYVIDPTTYEMQFINRNTTQILPSAKMGTRCYETIRGKTAPCDDCPMKKMRLQGTRDCRAEVYFEPYELWAKVSATMIRLNDGKEYGLISAYDFTEYKRQDGQFMVDADAFTRDTTLYDALTLSTDDYLFMCDMPKNLFYFPEPMVTEFDLPGQVIEDAIPLWGSRIHEEERPRFFAEITQMMQGEMDHHDQEYRVKNKDGKWVWLRCRGNLKYDENGMPTLFAGVITNLGKKSKIDSLTGLPDKYEFELQTRAKLLGGLEKGILLLMGLDNFKYINNLYGWEYGDAVLRETARQLQENLSSCLQLYRLDSDKFGIFFPSGQEEAAAYFNKISLLFQQQKMVGEQRYRCTISGGCAVVCNPPVPFISLFKQAEYALDFAKTEGKNRLRYYDDHVMSGKTRTLSIIALLQESVENDFVGFEVYYQPQAQPKTHKINSAEALLRWRCAEYGAVAPVEFVPLLEQTGLINAVGMWVLKEAAETCKRWRNTLPSFTINVNISYVQLQDKGFIPELKRRITQGTLDATAIHLELTESCIASGSSTLISSFETLRGMGFSIEMDDFGTGYSSLEILKNAPADVVKIDRAFVRDITRSDFDATFIQFVVSLCHSVNIQVCLEGVESWTEYYLVEPMGLDLIQGYLFGRPQPAAQFEAQFVCNQIETDLGIS